MATAEKKVETTDQPAADVAVPLTLDEFCARLSMTDKRVEMIAAFHHDETASRNFKDVEANFQQRFAVFVNKPA